MRDSSLLKKMILLVLSISLVGPIIAGIIILRNVQTSKSYQEITDSSIPKTMLMKEVLVKFREIRIHVRSVPIQGNTQEEIDGFYKATVDAIGDFIKTKEELMAKLKDSEEEIRLAKIADEKWNIFHQFGGELLTLIKKGDSESLKQVAYLVRLKCPVYATDFDKAVRDMISWQSAKVQRLTKDASDSAQQTLFISICLTILGLVVGISTGVYFAKNLGKRITNNMLNLNETAIGINERTEQMAIIAQKLSEASTQQASSLQQTASAIDEISAMVAQNNDNALSSAKSAEKSFIAVQDGKKKVHQMLSSIEDISSGNEDVIQKMNKSNKEIMEIVNLIQNISIKTQVINDIVFQTKLLSFNASVEAARAGEHGKGFAVVAEEVGNLASMSGKASEEISKMLEDSVHRVTEIVNSTNGLLDGLIHTSKIRVNNGTNLAKQCSESLDEIHQYVSIVNESMKSIAEASQEQARGIKEINSAVNEIEIVTRTNTDSANRSEKAATDLNVQIGRLNSIVWELKEIVQGKGEGQTVNNSYSKFQRNEKDEIVKEIKKAS